MKSLSGRSILIPFALPRASIASTFPTTYWMPALLLLAGESLAERPDVDRRRPHTKRVFRGAEQRVLDRLQFLQADEPAVEGAAGLDVGDRQADLEAIVGLRRSAGNDHRLDPLIAGIADHRHPGRSAARGPVAEFRRGIAVLLESRGQRRLVGEEERQHAQPGDVAHAAGRRLALRRRRLELDLGRAGVEPRHLAAASAG